MAAPQALRPVVHLRVQDPAVPEERLPVLVYHPPKAKHPDENRQALPPQRDQAVVQTVPFAVAIHSWQR